MFLIKSIEKKLNYNFIFLKMFLNRLEKKIICNSLTKILTLHLESTKNNKSNNSNVRFSRNSQLDFSFAGYRQKQNKILVGIFFRRSGKSVKLSPETDLMAIPSDPDT